MCGRERRGPICVETNRPSICTPGSRGHNDAGDPDQDGYIARLRNAIGIDLDNWVDAGVSGATVAVAGVMPASSALRLVFGWVASSTDQRDREAIERIVRYVADNPGAVVDNLKALGEAAIGAAQQQVSSDDLQQLGYRVTAGQHVLFSVMAAGIVWGFLKSIYEAIEGIIDIIGDLESFIDDSLELLESILSPEGEEACRVLGEQVGGSAATRIREIANENYLYAAFHIGEIVGPFVVAILLAYFTAGAGTAAMTSARVTQLLAKIRRIPRASRALDRLRRRMRRRQRPGPLADVTDAEINNVIEGIAEHPGSSPRPARRPRPQRAATSHRTAAARERFNRLRNGYAEELGVQNGGQVHHAIELNVLDRYPDVFTEAELNGFQNMRGIATELQNRRQLHNSKVREFWDRHYRRMDRELEVRQLTPGTEPYNRFVRDNLTQARDEIDHLLGQFFTEYRTGRPRSFD